MQTQPHPATNGGPVPAAALALLQGAIADQELPGAAFGRPTPYRAAEPEPAPEDTKAKTCKPTRNPCCKEDEDDGPESTKAKTCKPTRNPCCREDEEDGPQDTKAKTCKPTRNPCCAEDEGLSANASARGPAPDPLFL